MTRAGRLIRRTILTVLLLGAIPLSVAGQLAYGLKGGLSRSWIPDPDNPGVSRDSYSLGADLSFPADDALRLQAELLYVRRGGGDVTVGYSSSRGFGQLFEQVYELDYLDLSVQVGVIHVEPTPLHVRFGVFAGPTIARLLDSTQIHWDGTSRDAELEETSLGFSISGVIATSFTRLEVRYSTLGADPAERSGQSAKDLGHIALLVRFGTG